MKLVLEILEELFSMFVGDAALSIAVLATVAAAFAADRSGLGSVTVAGILVGGALIVLLASVWRAARAARARGRT